MDGKTLLRSLRELLGEASTSAYLDDRTSYQYLWDAACELARKTKALQSSTTITTVAEQSAYALPADFIELHLKDQQGELFVKYSDGTSTFFINFDEYEDIVFDNNTSSVSIPDRFSVIDKPTLYDQITGTATSAGTASGGKSTLTDTAGLFTTTDYVSGGDYIHNTTDSSSGIVLSVTSATQLETALFNDSTGAVSEWASSDAYVIQPQGRLQVVFDPPPSTAGHTVTVYYIQRPAPVFHSYGVYRFQPQYLDALVEYAAFKYKNRDREPGFANEFEQDWAKRVAAIGYATNQTFQRKGFRFSLSKKKYR